MEESGFLFLSFVDLPLSAHYIQPMYFDVHFSLSRKKGKKSIQCACGVFPVLNIFTQVELKLYCHMVEHKMLYKAMTHNTFPQTLRQAR